MCFLSPFDFQLSWWTIRNSEIWLQILDTSSPTLLSTNLQWCSLPDKGQRLTTYGESWACTDRYTSLYERILHITCNRIIQIKYLKFCISFLHRNMVLRLCVITHNCVTATLLYQLHYVNAIFDMNSVDGNVYCSPEAVEMCKLPNGAFILSTLLFDNSAIWFFLFSVSSLYLCLKYNPGH